MNARDAINAGVILAVAGGMLGAVAASLHHGSSATVERERCYGIARSGANDCANAVHSCATQSTTNSDMREWVWVPMGTCKRIAGGSLDERGKTGARVLFGDSRLRRHLGDALLAEDVHDLLGRNRHVRAGADPRIDLPAQPGALELPQQAVETGGPAAAAILQHHQHHGQKRREHIGSASTASAARAGKQVAESAETAETACRRLISHPLSRESAEQSIQ